MALIYITLAETQQLDIIIDILQNTTRTSPDPVRAVSITALCLISAIEEMDVNLTEYLETVMQDESTTTEVLVSALVGYGLIYTPHTDESKHAETLDLHMHLLASDDISVRTSAGENIALILEVSNEVEEVYYPRHEELVSLLTSLSKGIKL